MSVTFKKTPMSEQEAQSIASIVFVRMAELGMIDDATIAEHASLFPSWSPKWTGRAGAIVVDDKIVYRSIADVSNLWQNYKPSESPSKWEQIGGFVEGYPLWSKPIGVHDTYSKDDTAFWGGKRWISMHEGNSCEPGVCGWKEVKEE